MEKMKISLVNVGFNDNKINYKYPEAISCICGNCNSKVGLDVFLKYGFRFNNGDYDYYYVVGQCPVCGKPVIYDIKNNIVWPPNSSFENVQHLPEDIQKLYNEMNLTYSVGGYTCVVITARTMLSNVAITQGAKENLKFIDYVDYLVNNYLPASSSKPWVDKIRELANLSIHHLKLADKNDAELAMKFIVAILKNIYEFPNSI